MLLNVFAAGSQRVLFLIYFYGYGTGKMGGVPRRDIGSETHLSVRTRWAGMLKRI